MNLNTLKYFTVLLIAICSLNASNFYGQETIILNSLTTNHSNAKLRLKTEKYFSVILFDTAKPLKYNTKLRASNNLKYFPFQFGFEYGTTIRIKDKNYFAYGYWVYANLNFYDKRFFLTSEFGTLKLNEDLGNNASYLFLGLTGIPLVYKQHKLSISFGLSYYNSETTYALAFAGSIDYLYSINKYLSIIGGLKFPSIRKARYNEYFHNPMITVGIQIF